MEEKKEEKKEEKITRGYNLSKSNTMALRAEAFERTMAQDGGTVSASEVLDEIVTEWRRLKALKKSGKVAVIAPKGRVQ